MKPTKRYKKKGFRGENPKKRILIRGKELIPPEV